MPNIHTLIHRGALIEKDTDADSRQENQTRQQQSSHFAWARVCSCGLILSQCDRQWCSSAHIHTQKVNYIDRLCLCVVSSLLSFSAVVNFATWHCSLSLTIQHHKTHLHNQWALLFTDSDFLILLLLLPLVLVLQFCSSFVKQSAATFANSCFCCCTQQQHRHQHQLQSLPFSDFTHLIVKCRCREKKRNVLKSVIIKRVVHHHQCHQSLLFFFSFFFLLMESNLNSAF